MYAFQARTSETRGPRHDSPEDSAARRAMRHRCLAPLLGTLLVAAVPTGHSFAQDNEDCLSCHATVGLGIEREDRRISLYVDAERYAGSVHGDMGCIDCHEELDGVSEYPHAKGLKPVECGECHEDDDGPIAAYWKSTHGRRVEAGRHQRPGLSRRSQRS